MQSRLGTGSVVQIQQVEVARTSIYYREVHTECQGEEPNVDQKLTSCEAIKTSNRKLRGNQTEECQRGCQQQHRHHHLYLYLINIQQLAESKCQRQKSLHHETKKNTLTARPISPKMVAAIIDSDESQLAGDTPLGWGLVDHA